MLQFHHSIVEKELVVILFSRNSFYNEKAQQLADSVDKIQATIGENGTPQFSLDETLFCRVSMNNQNWELLKAAKIETDEAYFVFYKYGTKVLEIRETEREKYYHWQSISF